jgi:hypothetical protein
VTPICTLMGEPGSGPPTAGADADQEDCPLRATEKVVYAA